MPEDTCFDPEDGATNRLSLQLLTMNRKELSSRSWLRFDTKNQEFVGVPLEEEVRLFFHVRTHAQLRGYYFEETSFSHFFLCSAAVGFNIQVGPKSLNKHKVARLGPKMVGHSRRIFVLNFLTPNLYQ